MAVTVKRPIPNFNSDSRNTAKHFNQMTFKGIVQNNNPFDVDQLSLKNSKNVYVDENGTLISRPPIIVDTLPDAYIEVGETTQPVNIVLAGYRLVDMFETGSIRIYISTNNSPINPEYRLVAMNLETSLAYVIESVLKYHISAIDQYIIVFNNVDALTLDINNFNTGWIPLRDLAEVPVTKRVVGNEVAEFPKNQFTDSYKEDYIWSEQILPLLPDGEATVVVNQSPDNLTWTLDNANMNTEFRILRHLNVTVTDTDLVTAAINENTGISVITIGRSDHFLLSLDNGLSFERVLYPYNEGFLNIASISQDGLWYFMVAKDGVYRYNLDTKEWIVERLVVSSTDTELLGQGMHNASCFLNEETYTFALYHDISSTPTLDIYWHGLGLKTSDFAEETLGYTRLSNLSYPNTQLNKSGRDSAKAALKIKLTNGVASVVAWLPGQTATNTIIVNILGQGPNDLVTNTQNIFKPFGLIDDFNIVTVDPISANVFYGVRLTGTTTDNNSWYKVDVLVGQEIISATPTDRFEIDYLNIIAEDATTSGAPVNLGTGYIVDKTTHSVDGSANLPNEIMTADRLYTVTDGKNYYTIIDNLVYTNYMLMTNNAVITYNYISSTPLTILPDFSYTSDELYLAFGNTIKITSNIREGEKLSFELPIINNHSFTSNINALINISTTEIAVFLINQVYVVTQVPDEILGFRYDYRNTRLSTGVRLGDSVINTINGVFTLYPTIQGLAVMNYQPDVSNTDQVVEYVTNNIIKLWQEYYKEGPIKLVQLRDYVYLSNGSTRYLMLDLRGMSWWVFESVVPVTKIFTNQIDFNIISNGLYKYNYEPVVYKDLGTKHIDWFIESQPNHFNLPSHYKNIRQLIFQLEEATNIQQTIASQIKIYRKHLVVRVPEIIGFKVESYRTFIKRFNYWKINELQWALAADNETAAPAQLKLNGITIKYEIAEEVRS